MNGIHIAVIGAGPTTAYLLNCLLNKGAEHLPITIFEAQNSAGRGIPYCQANSGYRLLSNLSIEEVPPLLIPFPDWMQRNAITIKGAQVPRYLLGQYFHANFDALVQRFSQVRCILNTEVSAISSQHNTYTVSSYEKTFEGFSHVVINTGHFRHDDKKESVQPYPLTTSISRNIRHYHIIGSSMSAIDCTLNIAQQFGSFSRKDSAYIYTPRTTATVRMYSPSGQLPYLFYPSLKEQGAFRARMDEYASTQSHTTISIAAAYECVCKPEVLNKCGEFGKQVARLSLYDVITMLTCLRDKGTALDELKSKLISSNEEGFISQLEALFELFFDSLNNISHLLCEEEIRTYYTQIYRFLAKFNAALPFDSAMKIASLLECGFLTIEKKRIDSIPQGDDYRAGLRWIDCRNALSESPMMILDALCEQVKLAKSSVSGVTYLDVDEHFRVRTMTGSTENLFIGNVQLMRRRILSLPGLATSASIASCIAQKLATYSLPTIAHEASQRV